MFRQTINDPSDTRSSNYWLNPAEISWALYVDMLKDTNNNSRIAKLYLAQTFVKYLITFLGERSPHYMKYSAQYKKTLCGEIAQMESL